MKILLLFHHLRYPDERGGQRSREVAEALVSSGHDVTALIPNVDPLTEKRAISRIRGLWADRPSDKGYREIRYSVPATPRGGLVGRAFYSLVAFLNVFIFALVYCRRFHALAVTSHPLPIAFAALPFRWFGQAKVLVEIRDVPADVAVERGVLRPEGLFYRTYKYLERRLIRLSDAVIGYSAGMLYIAGALEAGKKTQVIPIGVDEPDNSAIQTAKSESHPGLKICFFGTLGKVIDLGPILETVRILQCDGIDVSLDIYGEGEKKEDLLHQVNSEGLPVYFKGLVARESVPGLCSQYDFAAYPVEGGKALGASLGNKFFDYLAAQTPMLVIGTASEPGRLVEQYKLGLTADTAEELTIGIKATLDGGASGGCELRAIFPMAEALEVFDKKRLLTQWSEMLESCV